MGTTQRLNPGVQGEPNWGNLNKSVTNIAKSIELENEIYHEEENNTDKSKEQFEKQYKLIYQRRNNYLKSLYRNLFETGGGRQKVSTGKSMSIGRAGIKSTDKIVSFITHVGSKGLAQALKEIGFTHLEGKPFSSVIDYLIAYCSDTAIDMDDTAANKASSAIIEQLAEQSGNDIDKFEKVLKGNLEGNGLVNHLCEFWGHYIFEHLSQRFQEKITQQKGEEVCIETFNIIRDDILGRVKLLNDHRPILRMDWQSEDGKKEIEKIFESIINILCDEN